MSADLLRICVLIIMLTQTKVTLRNDPVGEIVAMSYTSIGRVVAHLFFWFGVFQIALTIYYGFSMSEVIEARSAISKQLTSEFGEGMNRVFFGVSLGVLSEISSKRNKLDAEA